MSKNEAPDIEKREEGKFLHSEEWKFAKETLRNVFVFIVIAFAAMLLELIVKGMDASGFSKFFVVVLTILEYGLFGYDVIWFVSRLASSLYISVVNTIDSLELFIAHRRQRKKKLREISGTNSDVQD